MQKALISSSILFYMLKPSHLITWGFENNMMAQEKLFKCMCNFGTIENWREGISVVSPYLDVETTKDQCRLLNPTFLDCIAVYITEDYVSNRDLKRLPHRRH